MRIIWYWMMINQIEKCGNGMKGTTPYYGARGAHSQKNPSNLAG